MPVNTRKRTRANQASKTTNKSSNKRGKANSGAKKTKSFDIDVKRATSATSAKNMSVEDAEFVTPRLGSAKSQSLLPSDKQETVAWVDEQSQEAWDSDGGWGEGDDDGGWDDLETAALDASAEVAAVVEQTKQFEEHILQGGLDHKTYRFLSSDEVYQHLQAHVKRVAEELYITHNEALLLLLPFSFNATKAMNAWFDGEDNVRRTYSINKPLEGGASSSSSSSSSGAAASSSESGEDMVQCCTAMCDEVKRSEAYALPCGHWFCSMCMEGYLEYSLEGGTAAVNATCPAMLCEDPECKHVASAACKCKQGFAPSDFGTILSEEQFAIYKKWLCKLYVQRSAGFEECPRCSLVCYCPTLDATTVVCECKHEYCFSCLRDTHVPVPCDLIKRFEELDTDDIKTQQLLKATTKTCPHCNVLISKNKQCNHMRCTQCSYQFCWLCKGDWKIHGSSTGGYYQCNIHTKQMEDAALSTEEKDMIAEQQRVQKHTFASRKLEEHKASIKELKDLLERDNQLFIAFGNVVSRLCKAHTVLRFSYCLSYFLQDSSAKNVFNLQQDNLQRVVDELTKMFMTSTVEEMVTNTLDINTRGCKIAALTTRLEDAVNQSRLVEELSRTADDKSEVWGCINCGATYHDVNMRSCTKCNACRVHGEMACLASKCRTR